MNSDIMYLKMVGFVFPFVIGIAIFFIKRLMSSHDKQSEKIIDIEKNYVKKEELEQKQKELKSDMQDIIKENVSNIKEDMKNLKDEFNESNNKMVKSIDNLTNKVNDIQLNYISKEDFLKQNVALSSKIDKLTDMLIEEKTRNAR